jgi:hypothetical protein
MVDEKFRTNKRKGNTYLISPEPFSLWNPLSLSALNEINTSQNVTIASD